MKLEILKDNKTNKTNKTTNARVGSIMTVPTKMGEDWIEKGYAKDLSQPAPEVDPDQMNLEFLCNGAGIFYD